MPPDWLRETHIITGSREPIPQVTGLMRPVLLSPSQPFPSLPELLLSIPMALPRNGHLPTVEVGPDRSSPPPILTASPTVFHIRRLNLNSIVCLLGMVFKYIYLAPTHYIFKYPAMPPFPLLWISMVRMPCSGSNFSEIFETTGRLGGGSGGKIIEADYLGAPGNGPAHLSNPNQFNSGGKPYPGPDDYRASGLVGGNAAGGGSYGGIGGRPELTGGLGRNGTSIPASGKTYGTPDLVHLFAGSEVVQVVEQAGVLEPVRSRLWQRVP